MPFVSGYPTNINGSFVSSDAHYAYLCGKSEIILTRTRKKMTTKTIVLASLIGLSAANEPNDSTMRKEADTFISQMSPQLQPGQRDAIFAAIGGNDSALKTVRHTRNSRPVYPKNIEVTVPCEKMRLYTNADEKHTANKPLLIYLHGGGWTIGSLNSCARFCSEVCAQGGISVLAVDYRLAPEHPYPAPLDDCERAIRFAIENARRWGCSAERIIVGGDSSGGNLAIASTMRMKKGDVAGLLLFYPVVKAWNDGSASWKKYGKGFGLDGDLMEAFNQSYISTNRAHNAEISPLSATDEALSQLPRTLLIAAGRDILADQGDEFIRRTKALGVEATRTEFPSAIHLFITVPGQDTAFREAVRQSIEFITTKALSPYP